MDPIFRMPKDCEMEISFQVMVWFGDKSWILKMYEYRIRWWNKSMHENKSKLTIDQIS